MMTEKDIFGNALGGPENHCRGDCFVAVTRDNIAKIRESFGILDILRKHASMESESPGIEDIGISVCMESDDYAKIREWLETGRDGKERPVQAGIGLRQDLGINKGGNGMTTVGKLLRLRHDFYNSDELDYDSIQYFSEIEYALRALEAYRDIFTPEITELNGGGVLKYEFIGTDCYGYFSKGTKEYDKLRLIKEWIETGDGRKEQ